MRGLNRRALGRRGREAGISAVVFAVAAPLLIGALGLSIDTGNLTLQKSGAQRAADAAATAIGQDCATQRSTCSPTGGGATAQLMVNGNAPGATSSISSGLAPSRGSVTVTVNRTVTMPFASVIGVAPRTVTRSATVEWGQTPVAGTTLPMGMNVCDVNAWLIANRPKTPKFFRYDSNQDGRGPHTDAAPCPKPGGGTDTSIKGGLWLANTKSDFFDESTCTVKTGISDRLNPSQMFSPRACLDRTDAFAVGQTYLMSVFISPGWGGWGNATASIKGYVPFVLTGWRIDGNGGLKTSSPAPAGCTGSCRGVQGYFTGTVIRLEGIDSYGTNPNGNYGAVRVKQTS